LSVFAACNDCSAGYSSQRCLRIRRRCPTAHGVIRQILALCYPPLLIQSSLIADFLPKKGYYLNLSLQKHRTYAPAHCLSNYTVLGSLGAACSHLQPAIAVFVQYSEKKNNLYTILWA